MTLAEALQGAVRLSEAQIARKNLWEEIGSVQSQLHTSGLLGRDPIDFPPDELDKGNQLIQGLIETAQLAIKEGVEKGEVIDKLWDILVEEREVMRTPWSNAICDFLTTLGWRHPGL